MVEIAAVRSAGGGSPLVELVLDDGSRLRLHPRRLEAPRLAAGARLSQETVEQLRRAEVVDRCEQRALRLLATRDRSRFELDRRLAAWGLDEAERAPLLVRLEQLGVVDDDALAGRITEGLRRRGHGHLRARADLERYGIPKERAAAVAEGHAEGDLAAAGALIEQRFGQPPLAGPAARRAAGLLGRRGFDQDVIAAVLRIDE